MTMQLILWISGTSLITYISLRALRQPGSHGFYRFFAWESILTLAILNLPIWFTSPFAAYQLVSWTLLLASLIPLIQGIGLLRKQGESRGEVEDSANFAFENTTHLVTNGVYAYIRHPLYASLLYLTWGIYAKDPRSQAGLLLVVTASIFLYLTAYNEEQENIRSFGAEYKEYMKKTKRFVPYLF